MDKQNFGFIESPIENDHWLLGDGALSVGTVMPDGHGWGSYLPTDQIQARGNFESQNCTAYGTLHAIATLGNKKFGASFQHNLSERYLGIMSGTTITGNNPHKVAETIRTGYGVVPDADLPFDQTIQTWTQYYSPNPMAYWLYAVGAHWLKKYAFGHDWVFLAGDLPNIRQQKMMYALRFSPLGASGFAWSQHDDGLFYSDQNFQNHWFTIYDFEEGKSWSAFDSYDQTHKKLDWNFTFGQAKRYSLDYNIGGKQLRSVPGQVYVPYALYLGLWYVQDIFK